MRWRWGSPWSTQIDHSDRVPAARRPHVMQPSRAYSFFIHSLWSCGPYYECNGRGYAVLPGVDIRCVPVAFSPSIKSYFHEKDNGGWGIVFTGKTLACRVFLIKRPYSSKELWNFTALQSCGTSIVHAATRCNPWKRRPRSGHNSPLFVTVAGCVTVKRRLVSL